MIGKNKRWRVIIADAIIRLLDDYRRNDIEAMDFVGDVAEQDAELNDPRNIKDADLSDAWNSADTFCDAVTSGALDKIRRERAAEYLEEIALKLRNGESIENLIISLNGQF